MNFEFDINPLLPHEITKFNSDLRIVHPSHVTTDDPSYYQLNRDMKQKLTVVIDRMGEASSRAQGLREIITSYRKLALNDHHRIYLMKDSSGNNGKGSIVGLLKVGEKNLFLHDHRGQNHEIMPLCVLDFYVYDNQQRKGFGLRLFNKMLEMEGVQVQHLAIDSPSDKSIKFLKKHYDLKNPLNQTNSYVVFGGFFDRPGLANRNNRKFNSALPYKHELPPLDKKNPSTDLFHYNSNSSWLSQSNQAVKNLPTKSVNVANEKSTNHFKSEPEIRQNRYDPFMEANFANRHKFDPFPSLNPFNNRTNVNTKANVVPSESRTNTQNTYNPFPSLNAVAKTNISPDLYTNQFYMNSKFRRTKLW